MADKPPESTPPPEPSAADATAIATAVVAEMQRVQEAGGSREEAETAASAEIQRQLEISESDADRIAEAVIKGLDQRGVFEPPPAETPAEPVESPANTDPETGGEPAHQEPAGGEPTEPAPRNPTFAERFLGKR